MSVLVLDVCAHWNTYVHCAHYKIDLFIYLFMVCDCTTKGNYDSTSFSKVPMSPDSDISGINL